MRVRLLLVPREIVSMLMVLVVMMAIIMRQRGMRVLVRMTLADM
jgi:hypothetical protein